MLQHAPERTLSGDREMSSRLGQPGDLHRRCPQPLLTDGATSAFRCDTQWPVTRARCRERPGSAMALTTGSQPTGIGGACRAAGTSIRAGVLRMVSRTASSGVTTPLATTVTVSSRYV